MTSWYCVELWRVMIALPLLVVGSTFSVDGLRRKDGLMFLVGFVATAGSVLLLLIPTVAGGGG